MSTFRDILPVPSSRVRQFLGLLDPWRWGWQVFSPPEMSEWDHHTTLRKIPKERRSRGTSIRAPRVAARHSNWTKWHSVLFLSVNSCLTPSVSFCQSPVFSLPSGSRWKMGPLREQFHEADFLRSYCYRTVQRKRRWSRSCVLHHNCCFRVMKGLIQLSISTGKKVVTRKALGIYAKIFVTSGNGQKNKHSINLIIQWHRLFLMYL